MSGNKKKKTKVRPMQARVGARYTCFGDGLCCTDIHGIGPLSEKEVRRLRKIERHSAGWNEEHEDNMMCTAADGGCMFLREDQLCSIHARFGPDAKPEGCRRFPLGLVATPIGGRITTDHRCPCRTMGDRPEIVPETIEGSLADGAGRPTADRRIKRIPLDKRRSISFAEWEPIEAEYLKSLQGRGPLSDALSAKPFPKLRGSTWQKQAREFIDARDGTRFGIIMSWMGDTMLSMLNGHRPRPPARPWAEAFDRAEARSKTARTSREVFGDWLADEVWSLKWAEDYDFALARAELATRVAIAEDVCHRLHKDGLRKDRAAAEAVMIVEVVGESEYWTHVKDCIRV